MRYAPVDPPPRLLMGPGPITADPRVLRAMSAQLLGQFDPAMTGYMTETMALYRQVFRTANEQTFLVDGTSRAGIEAALVSLLEPGDRVLVPVFGRFGHLLTEIASRCGAEVHTVETEWGQVFAPSVIEQALARVRPTVLAVVHGDTSTTVAQPLDELGELAHRHGALLYSDATASLGGNEFDTDGWGLDVVTAGLQKCLGGPSGSAPITIAPRAVAVIEARKHVEAGIRATGEADGTRPRIASNYLDLAQIMDYWGPRRLNHHTEATTMLYGARECARLLVEEGIDAAVARHAEHGAAMLAGLQGLGLQVFGDLAHRMANVVAVFIPDGVDGESVRAAMLHDFGIEIGTSFGPLHGVVWRIGTMGYNARRDAVLLTLAALEQVLRQHGAPVVAAVASAPRWSGTSDDGGLVLERCAALNAFSSSPWGLERVYLSPEHAAANAEVAGWMQQAGLRTWQDAAGNQWGRLEGREPGLPALVLGSHLDTVRDAGSYDGMLGVVMAVAVAERARTDASSLPFALEVVGFSDEEGTRFGKALLGSQAVAGTWDDAWWSLRDRDGVTLRQAFVDFGLDPAAVRSAARSPSDVVAYLEAHIEQGPYLEAADRSLGVVSGIAGARRLRLTVVGEARHAGGTPYPRRRDALIGAAQAVLAVERAARESGCIATVGQLAVEPGAVNVIPGRAVLSVDLRAETDAARDALWSTLEAELQEQSQLRGLTLEVVEQHRAPAVSCAPWLRQAVAEGIRGVSDDDPKTLWSRAGHDAMAMAALTDVGMLFLRCYDGISHHPKESVRAIDVARGLDAFEAAVQHVAVAVGSRVPR